ncbi:Cohesin subunit SA-1 [Anabarilius grahami]|uniref:Cohesin subunit SA n=1 Tax=Anabarilius grahami TaxID=495550 RepID=A0A3N0Z513_ANAGA|nr:Cohesin subunit SA-1 [Anabarilius grahami]
MDVSELYSSEDEEVSLTGSDFEFQLKTSERKRISTQEATSPKRVHHPSVSGSCSSQSQTPEDRRHSAQTDCRPTASHLYEAVRSGRSALLTVIDDWLDEYRRDREAGLLELINFVVQCSGCKGVVTREMLSSLQNADIISHLTKEFNEDSVSYPLVSPGSQWRHFREGVCEFVSLLVRGCRNTLLYDDFLFSSLIALLTGLADSQVRAFRHTSTLIAMRLMSSIVSVAADVNAQALMTQRRCELEKNKPVEQRAIDRVEELENSYRELLEHQEDLRSLMSGVFKGVFVHRYRDRVPEIRAVCMEEMGMWLRENPVRFLNDEHLKYVGWMLHDKQAAVRLQCVLTLQKLYEEKDFISRLELFTSRFKERIVCTIRDKDSDVAVEAVKLLLLIHQLCSVLDGRSDKRSVSFLRLLAHFFIKSEVNHSHPIMHLLVVASLSSHRSHDLRAVAVTIKIDSLWDVAGKELKDWDVMTSLLLQEGGVEDELESTMIDIMMCAVRQAAEATPPTSRSQKKTVTAREKRLQAQERRRITNHFIPVFPQLLAKFSADVGKVSRLLTAPLYFQLEVYGTSGRLEKCLDLLLSQVCDIMLKHHKDCVLEACVRVLCALCSDCYSFCGRMERAVSQLLDSTVEKFSTNVSEILQGSADEDDFYGAASSLNILAIFSRCVCVCLMVPALKCAAFHLFWKGVAITKHTAATQKAELKRVLKSLHSFCVVCQSCLSVAQSRVRNQAFECLCDVLIVFGRTEGDGSPLQRFSLDESLKAEMASFIIDYVFNDTDSELSGEDEDEEMKMAALLQRRNQLAGYCKLIIYGVLELRAATDILKYYNKFYKDYGDIIKETLSKSKMISSVEKLMEIRLLAKKLAVNFSINLRLVRQPLLALHQDGIRFACQGLDKGDLMNLSFLEILSEFSFKLLQPERKKLLEYLRRVCSSVLNRDFVRMYERSLTSGSKETPASAAQTPRRKRRRTQSSVGGLETAAVVSHTRHDDMDDNEFTDGYNTLNMRLYPRHSYDVKNTFLRKSVSRSRPQSSPLSQSVRSHLSSLSLAHEDHSEDEEEPEIEDYDDEDSEMGFVLPSTHGSASFLEDLFK